MFSSQSPSARVAIQFGVAAALGFLIPKVLFSLQWRVGEGEQYPAGVALFLCGLILVAVYPKTWWVAGIGALIGLCFGAENTSKFGGLYVFVFAPWAWFGGLIGRIIWDAKRDRPRR